MRFPTPMLPRTRLLWRWAAVVLLPPGLVRATEEPVAVFSQVFNGYTRTRLPDKSFKPETYVFGEGGSWTRPVKDPAMEQMTFVRVAHAAAVPLARLNYRPAPSSAEAELLILVFWGATEGSRDSSPASLGPQSPDRYMLDDRNARILGYTEALGRAAFAPNMPFLQDSLVEIGRNRFFVVLQAYDFKTAVQEKKLKPLWTARISMEEAGNDFAQSLDQMLQKGARYFGQDSGGLRRDVTREGRVEIGPIEVIGTSPQK